MLCAVCVAVLLYGCVVGIAESGGICYVHSHIKLSECHESNAIFGG